MPTQQELDKDELQIREEQRKKAIVRNQNTMTILVIDNGIVIKSGDEEFDYKHFNTLDSSAINFIQQFIMRRNKINNEYNGRGNASRRSRMADRREVRKPIKMNTIEDAF